MKNRLGVISLLSLGLCLTSAAGEPTWKAYVKLLNKMYVGLTPYKMPNPADGPGTIYFIDDKGVEQLYFDQKTAFPDLSLQPPMEIPTAHLSRMSNMQFKVGLNIADEKILTNEVMLVASLAIAKDTHVTVSVAKPKVYRAQDGLINSEIVGLDIRNPIHEDILKKLQRPNVTVISGALRVDSFVYTFHRKSAIDSNLDANLGSKSKGLNVTYKKITDTEFTLEARSPMFWAYYAYPIDRAEIEQLYNDKLKLKELEDAEAGRANYQREVQRFKEIQSELSAMMAMETRESGEIKELEKTLQEKRDQQKTTTGAVAASLSKIEIENLELRIIAKKDQIKGLQGKVESYRQEAQTLNVSRVASLETPEDKNVYEIKSIKEKKYVLFGKKVIIPLEIRAGK